MENKNPLSPHIQIYRWHISSLVSISHRITGINNIVAITLVCIWVSLLVLGDMNYNLRRLKPIRKPKYKSVLSLQY